MPREVSKLLHDVLTAGAAVQSFVQDKTLEDYEADLLLRSAIERQLLIIGEALMQLRQVAPDIAERLPELQGIIRFRNLAAHGYFALVPERVWLIVPNELEPTLEVARELMEEAG